MAKINKLIKGKKKFIVETVNTFVEAHVVYAKDEEEAQFIAENSDYNASKWLGQFVSNISDCTEEGIQRISKLDSYFFQGAATIDENGFRVYVNDDGSQHGNMPLEKIR
jgi:hypothetical protein